MFLLLCNGYDPNRERHCPLDRALEDRQTDLVELLLEWGTDPHRADLSTLFGTYDSELFERCRKLGVDLTAGHALASALGHHTSSKPLNGYAKRRRKCDPKIQTELNVALFRHASDGNEKGVSLCLWAGADPHAPSLRWDDWEDEDDEEGRFVGFSAIYHACGGGNVTVLEKLGPDPARDELDKLYEAADNSSVVDFLARFALPEHLGAVLRRHFWWVGSNFSSGGWRAEDRRALGVIEAIFRAGAR